MKVLLDLLEKRVKPLFAKGRPLHKLEPVYEATDTFLFTSPAVTPGAPHVRDAADMKRWMITVVVALIPCVLWGIFNAGYQHNRAAGAAPSVVADLLAGTRIVLPIILVSYAVGGLWEVLFACVRKHEINEGFLVTGLLFPLTLPPSIPLWQVALGISFGVVIGKEIFGGVGFNVLNPALAGRAFLYFAYPAQMSGDVWVARPAHLADGFSGATSIEVAKAAGDGTQYLAHLREHGFTLPRMVLGLEPGSIGETSMLCVLLGAAVLLLTRVGAWRIMLSGVLGVAAIDTLVNLAASPAALAAKPMYDMAWYVDLAMGGSLFGIVFMATDPVSAAATNEGKWVYGFLIGALTSMVRLFNPAYPAGNMMAILFMNVMAPLVDYVVLQLHIRSRAAYLRRFRHAQ